MESKKKYKVVKVTGYPVLEEEIPEDYRKWATEMQEYYGLTHLTIEEIIKGWRIYSDVWCASWLVGSKRGIEDCFGVELEEI